MSILTRSTALLLTACLALPLQTTGQTTLAIRGGASIATLGGDDADGVGSRTGLNIGGAITFGVSPNLGVQIGGAFVQKGAAETEEGVDIKFALDYIEVPVLLRLGVPSSGAFSPHFVFGPAVSFKAGCEVEASSQGVTASVTCSEGDLPIKSIDLGGVAGAGIDIATSGTLSVTLDVLYNFGLTTIDDSSPADDVKNRSWSIIAGIALPIG